jgi:hypothetical protein
VTTQGLIIIHLHSSSLFHLSKKKKDDIVKAVLPFIEANIKHQSWKHREAATLAFGAILEGPRTDSVQQLVQLALPIFVEHMKDPVVHVRDTSAWVCNNNNNNNNNTVFFSHLLL